MLQRLSQSIKGFAARFPKIYNKGNGSVQQTILQASQRLNELTGYSSIEALKNAVVKQETKLRDFRLSAAEARKRYIEAVEKRSSSQREVNELLQRRSSWSTIDLERFTKLYRDDYSNKEEEIKAQEDVDVAERRVEEAQNGLVRSILSRYHEEQVWSDKIRQASTWGTWGLMGINVVLFVVVQLILEPRKRKRLVREAVDHIDKERELEINDELKKISEKLDKKVEAVGQALELTSPKIDNKNLPKNSASLILPPINYDTFHSFLDSLKYFLSRFLSTDYRIQLTYRQLSILATKFTVGGGVIIYTFIHLFGLAFKR